MKKKKVKVFLSLGFKGRSRDEVLDIIQKMKDCLNKHKPEDVEYEVCHNYYCTPPFEYMKVKHESIYYLGAALNMMSKCDVVLVNSDDILDHNGVAVELNTAVKYGIPLMIYNKNDFWRLKNEVLSRTISEKM